MLTRPSFRSALFCMIGAAIGAAVLTGCSSVGLSAGTGGLVVGGAVDTSGKRLVAGTLTYAERVLLADSSVVQVQVLDVTDATADILGGTEFTTNGLQIPLPFEIQIPKRLIRSGAKFVVRATIEDPATSLRFTTKPDVPLSFGEETSNLELVLVSSES